MEAFSLIKFWRITTGDDPPPPDSNDGSNQAAETDYLTDDEDSFFDLEFSVPGEEKEKNDTKGNDLAKKECKIGSDFIESPNNVFFKGRVSPLESNSKPQSPISFLRSPPKIGVLMLFKKSKIESSPGTPKHNQQSKRFTVKYKIEEVPIFSFLSRVNSSRSKSSENNASSKRFAKDVVHKYLNLIKPLYVRASKRYSENLNFSDEISVSSPSSSPATLPVRSPRKQTEEKQGSRVTPPPPLRGVCKQLVKSRSASSSTGIVPSPVRKRNDSLLLRDDGIQSAILHCKSSYSSSRGFSALSRSASDTTDEISVNHKNSTEEKKRSSI